jgi:hypothetical protein
MGSGVLEFMDDIIQADACGLRKIEQITARRTKSNQLIGYRQR